MERELTTEKFFNIRYLEWLPERTGLLLTASKTPDRNYYIWQVSSASGNAAPLTKDSESYSVLNIDREAKLLVSTQVEEDFRLRYFQLDHPAAAEELTDARTVSFLAERKNNFLVLNVGKPGDLDR